MSAPLLSLPDEVLQRVLAHVPLKHRLGSCCHVHTRLHAAAVAATQQVEVGSWLSPPPPQRVQSLLSWLSPNGQHVTSLRLQYLSQPLLQLPCVNLLELHMREGSIQLGPTADGRPGVIDGITNLTRLELCECNAVDGPVVDSLSRLVHLRHLDWSLQPGADGVSLSDATLPCLRQLTHLSACLPLSNVLQLGALTSLQELGLDVDTIGANPSSVAGLVLPHGVTKLLLASDTDTRLDAALLALAPAELRSLCIDWGGVDGLEPPMSCMTRLQCLSQLKLCAWETVSWPPAGPLYSAVTASSGLVSLQVGGKLPAGVWPFVFPATHQLPHLTSLTFNNGWSDRDAAWAFGPADLAGLMRCCPGVCEIRCICLQPGSHVSELRKLTALTYLNAGCARDLVGTVKGLAAVTRLKALVADLESGTAHVPSASVLLPLTSLTALTTIYCAWSDEDAHEVSYLTQAGSPPDVWLQLLERCADEDPGCQPTALRSLAQQLAEQRALTTRQQQQLSAPAQQIAAHAQVAAAEQAAAVAAFKDQQQQLVAQQRVAAEQAARIAALEGQLQQLMAQQQGAAAQGARVAALECQLQQLLQRLL